MARRAERPRRAPLGDFYETWINSRGPHPYTDTPLGVASSYFPLAHILMFPLTQLSLTLSLRTIAAFVRRRRGLVAMQPPSVAGANAGR